MPFKQKEFERLYRYMDGKVVERVRLAGIVEASNRARYPEHVPEPKRIGCAYIGTRRQLEAAK